MSLQFKHSSDSQLALTYSTGTVLLLNHVGQNKYPP